MCPLFTSLLCLCASACKNKDLVENELRARDIQYREALEELGKAETRNDSLLREVEALRKGSKFSPEKAALTFGLKRIALGRGTMGLDDDGLPGDEKLQVVVEPRDADDHFIKTPGRLQIIVMEINFQGVKMHLSTHVIEPDQLRQHWKQGLLSTGYHLQLTWKAFPQNEKLRIIARLVLSDGRIYETDKDIKVRLVPGAPRHEFPPPPTPLPEEGPAILPSNHVERRATPVSNWQPVPLTGAVELGRPIPITP
ncbi:MAG: hypothetical protein L0Y72_14740 [Gemmataceae bacterium]|nr:hypothetical protein [Gemmataceae bacterium]MCI0740299.1 hypothetical protein [Gemmataceae bacterium]